MIALLLVTMGETQIHLGLSRAHSGEGGFFLALPSEVASAHGPGPEASIGGSRPPASEQVNHSPGEERRRGNIVAEPRQVTYCGLYCGLCAQGSRIPKQASALRESMRREAWDRWGQEIPRFKEFWAFLDWLVASEAGCNCREEKCGPPTCGIRRCAQGKGVNVCPFCDEYPCRWIAGLAKGYVNLLADGKRMTEIGLERWVEEQEARKTTGFAYVDIRCHPYEIPDT
jgi:hypothetical protein